MTHRRRSHLRKIWLACAFIMFLMLAYVPWAGAAQPQSSITLQVDEQKKTIQIHIGKQAAYSSLEFGLKLEGNLRIKSIEYNEAIESSKVGVREKDGIHYFGFFDHTNKYSDEMVVCTVYFEAGANGKVEGKVTLSTVNITRMTEAGGAKKEILQPELEAHLSDPSPESPRYYGGFDPGCFNDSMSMRVEAADTERRFTEQAKRMHGRTVLRLDELLEARCKHLAIEVPSALFSGEEQRVLILPTQQGTVHLSTELVRAAHLPDGAYFEVHLKQLALDEPHGIEILFSSKGQTIQWDQMPAFFLEIPYHISQIEPAALPRLVVSFAPSAADSEQIVKQSTYDEADGFIKLVARGSGQYKVQFVELFFADLDHTWAKQEIETLAARGIIQGTSIRAYSPELQIKRADFIKLLVGVLDLEKQESAEFLDVPSHAYYYESVQTARAVGLVQGRSAQYFDPETLLSRQEMMVLLDRAMLLAGVELHAQQGGSLTKFLDANQIAGYAVESVSKLVENGVIQGNLNRLRPQDALTRAEAARVLYMFEKLWFAQLFVWK